MMDDQHYRPRGTDNSDGGMSEDQRQGGEGAGRDFHPFPGDDRQGEITDSRSPRKQSGLGIASFILAMACLLFIVISVLLIAASVQDYIGTDGSVPTAEDIEARVMTDGGLVGGVLLFLGSLALGFVGLVLGIVGLAMRGRRKVYAIIGTVLNGLVIVGFTGIILMGTALQGSLAP